MVTLAELAMQPLLLSSSSVSRLELDLAMTREGLSYDSVEECDQSQAVQALAAIHRGVGVVTDLPRFGLYGVLIQASTRTPEVSLGVSLHAAWDRHHYSTKTLESLAQRLKDFLHGIIYKPITLIVFKRSGVRRKMNAKGCLRYLHCLGAFR